MMKTPKTYSTVMLLEETMRIQAQVVLNMAPKATKEWLSRMK